MGELNFAQRPGRATLESALSRAGPGLHSRPEVAGYRDRLGLRKLARGAGGQKCSR